MMNCGQYKFIFLISTVFLHCDSMKYLSLSLSLSNGATAQDGPQPPLRVSFILPGLGRLLSRFHILAMLHLPAFRLPNAV